MAALAVALCAGAADALAAPGDKIADLALPGTPKGVSVAFDGKYLYYTELNGLALNRIGTDGVSGRESVAILGAPGINALAYDATKDKFWAVDATGLNFYVIDKSGLATLQFAITPVTHLPGLCGNALGCSTVIDGLAYDSGTDTLWYSPRDSKRVYHFSTVGDYLGYFDPTFGPECPTGASAGLAAGRDHLYLTSNGCARVYEYGKNNDLGTAARTADFLAFTGRAADAECDSSTFAVNVAWVRDAEDGHVRAFELPAGMCYGGGGIAMPNENRMTGGGETKQEFPQAPKTREIMLGYSLHCVLTRPDQPPNRTDVPLPNNFQATWQVDADGDGEPDRTERFHLMKLTHTTCSPEPLGGGYRIEFRGFGRANGKRCAPPAAEPPPFGNLQDTSHGCGFVNGYLIDRGEPGSQPGPDETRDLNIVDAQNFGLVSGCMCPLPNGNYQFHPAQVS